MADIIDMTKLRDAQAAADATAHLHEILCIAAGATATRALNAEGRMLLAEKVTCAALGSGWGGSYAGKKKKVNRPAAFQASILADMMNCSASSRGRARDR